MRPLLVRIVNLLRGRKDTETEHITEARLMHIMGQTGEEWQRLITEAEDHANVCRKCRPFQTQIFAVRMLCSPKPPHLHVHVYRDY